MAPQRAKHLRKNRIFGIPVNEFNNSAPPQCSFLVMLQNLFYRLNYIKRIHQGRPAFIHLFKLKVSELQKLKLNKRVNGKIPFFHNSNRTTLSTLLKKFFTIVFRGEDEKYIDNSNSPDLPSAESSVVLYYPQKDISITQSLETHIAFPSVYKICYVRLLWDQNRNFSPTTMNDVGQDVPKTKMASSSFHITSRARAREYRVTEVILIG